MLPLQKRTEKFVVNLNADELISLVDLILCESELSCRDTGQAKGTLDQASCSLIQSRLPLLHSCCQGNMQSICKVSEYLINCVKKWGDRYGFFLKMTLVFQNIVHSKNGFPFPLYTKCNSTGY